MGGTSLKNLSENMEKAGFTMLEWEEDNCLEFDNIKIEVILQTRNRRSKAKNIALCPQ